MSSQLFIPSSKGFEVFLINDILYFKGSGSYSEIFFSRGGSHKLVSILLKDIEVKLATSTNHFFRIHKSYLINVSHIKEYRNGSEKVIVMLDDTRVPVATRRIDEFCEWCKERFIHLC